MTRGTYGVHQCSKLTVVHRLKRVKLAKQRVEFLVSRSHGRVEVLACGSWFHIGKSADNIIKLFFQSRCLRS